MDDNNNTHANGDNNGSNGESEIYTLLHPGETIDTPNIPWLERFSTFLHRVGGGFNWRYDGGNGEPWRATLSVNGNELNDVTGQGQSRRAARVHLVRQLQQVQHNLLRRPLLPEYQVNSPPNGNPTVNDNLPVNVVPSSSGSSSGESSTPNNGTSAPE